jgi:hypothetical protein
MKCVQCGADAKKKDRDAKGGRCPACNHPFVTEPSVDGVTDMEIKNAEKAVSGNGTFYFSKEQLEYQLQRKYRKRARWTGIVSSVLLLLFIIMLMAAIREGGGFIPGAFFSGIIGLIFFGIKSKSLKTLKGLEAVINKWLLFNPNPQLIKPGKFQNTSSNNNLEDVSFDRVLICDKNETVDFFLSNLFHFHYSCPVLGGKGYPQGIYEDMLRRLKQNPNLKVFLLHDCSAEGLAFVRKMKTDRNWFGDGHRYQIIDLGLNIEQKKKLFKSMTNKQKSVTGKIKEVADVMLFKPAMLIMLCGAAINEAVALDQVQLLESATHDNGGYG